LASSLRTTIIILTIKIIAKAIKVIESKTGSALGKKAWVKDFKVLINMIIIDKITTIAVSIFFSIFFQFLPKSSEVNFHFVHLSSNPMALLWFLNSWFQPNIS